MKPWGRCLAISQSWLKEGVNEAASLSVFGPAAELWRWDDQL